MEVAEFLKSALPLVEAEPGTVSWFAIQEGSSSFAIFDTFNDESGRDAHLDGKVAAALMAKAGELLAKLLVARLDREIEQSADDKNALTAEQRRDA